jgi:hypothetical protein
MAMRLIRNIAAPVTVGLLACGCTATALRQTTLSVSGTVGSILERQALDNLAQFYDAPFSIPSQVVLSTGVVTIQDQLNTGVKLPYTVTLKNSKEADLNANFQWTAAWTITPVTDSGDLVRLQYLYRNAVRHVEKQSKALEELSSETKDTYLSFGPISIGGSFDIPAPAEKPVDCIEKPLSRFENCKAMERLLDKAGEWLRIDNAPPENASADTEKSYRGDPFVYKNRHTGHTIWVREREFSELMTYILFATPKSNETESQKPKPGFAFQ